MANDKGSKYISSKRSYSTAVKPFTVILEVSAGICAPVCLGVNWRKAYV